eukprot:g5125.t1
MILDPASWFRTFFHGHQKVQWEDGDEPLFLGFVPYDNTLFFTIVVLPACLFNLLVIWSCISHAREPSWVRNATSISKFWTEIANGSTVGEVQSGHLCRKYMGHFNPGILRFTNGTVLGGYLRDFLLVKDPVVVKQVLEETNTRKPERSYRVFRRLHGYRGGYDFLSFRSHKDPIYRRTRNKVYRALMKRTYDHFDDVIMPEVAIFVDSLADLIENSTERNEGVAELHVVDEMHTIATTLLCRVGFGESSTVFQRSLFESTIWMVNDMLRRPANCAFPWLDSLPTPTNATLHAHQERLSNVILSLIRKKRAQGRRGDDVVSVLLNDPALTDDDLLGILAIFFFAGFDTTANSMTMILYNLARNPDAQRKAYDDARAILLGETLLARTSTKREEKFFNSDGADGDVESDVTLTPKSTASVPGRPPPHFDIGMKTDDGGEVYTTEEESGATPVPSSSPRAIKIDQLFQMKYLTACVKETLRMFPVVPMISREVTEAHSSGVCPRFNEDKTFGIAINMFGLHYNPAGWSNPDQFLPERWLDPSIDGKKDPSQRVYCPFAIGKRSCLGRHFAYVEMLSLVSAILLRYEVLVVQKDPPALIEAGTLLIDPKLRLGLRLRTNETPRPRSLTGVTYTLDQVAQHHAKGDLWMAINGAVYDLTRFVEDKEHPGGSEILLTYGGTNATAEYEFISHSAYATKLLEKYRIGELHDNQTPLFKEKDWKTGNFRETVRVYSEDWESTIDDRKSRKHASEKSRIRRRRGERKRRSATFC